MAVIRVGADEGWFSNQVLLIAAAVIAVILIIILLLPTKREEVRSEVSRVPVIEDGVFDPFEEGYPVPPMPGQILPEFADVLVGPDGEVIADNDDEDKEA